MSREDFNSLWKRAKRYSEQGDYLAALKIYQKLEKMGFSFELLEAKGLVYAMMGKFKEARQISRKGQREAQRRGVKEIVAKFWFQRINVLIVILGERKKYSQAIKILEGALRIDCQNPELHNLLAQVYIDLENWDLALEELEKVLKLEKYEELKADAFFSKGLVLKNKGDIKGAKQAYLQAIKNNSGHVKSYINLGVIYCLEGNEEEGFQMWQQAEKLGCGEIGLFYNLATFYLRRQDWDKSKEYIRKIIEKNPQEVRSVLNMCQTSEAYLLIIDEILEMGNQKAEEEFLRVLREEKCDRENIEPSLIFRGLEEIDKIERRTKKGKKIRARDRRVLDLMEAGLKIIDQVEIEERKARQRLISERETLIRVLKSLIEKQKEEQEVYEKFFLKYRDFIDEEEFRLYLEEAKEKRKLILTEIERVVDIFIQEFKKRNLELVVDGISLDEKETISSGLRIIERGRGNHSLKFVFNIASKRFLESVDLEELTSHYVSQAEMWDKLPDYLADGSIAQVPESVGVKKWLASQKLRSIETKDYQEIAGEINREGLNLVADILKPHFQDSLKKELVYLKNELNYWQESITQEGIFLEELPILIREMVVLEKIPEKVNDVRLQEKFKQLRAGFEELKTPNEAYLNEIYRFYQDLVQQIKIIKKEVKKKKEPK